MKLTKEISEIGTVYLNNRGNWHNPHRPAFKDIRNYQAYFIYDRWHNIVGPARIGIGGTKTFYIKGKSLNNL